MQTLIRYSVVNQDGKPVIRAVPVVRCANERAARRNEPAAEQRERSLLERIRQLRVLDLH